MGFQNFCLSDFDKLTASDTAGKQQQLLQALLYWAESSYQLVCFFNSNNITGEKNKTGYDAILAVGDTDELIGSTSGNLDRLKEYLKRRTLHQKPASGDKYLPGWIFGFLSYDLKNEIEDLSSLKPDRVEMPLLHFFAPEHIFFLNSKKLTVRSKKQVPGIKELLSNFSGSAIPEKTGQKKIHFSPRISRRDYIEEIKKIKNHIQRGDIYEMNYCQEFFAETVIDPVNVYNRLNSISPMPFSCFYKFRDKYLLCSSPERFLNRSRKKIISQPIKGTIRRGKTEFEDQQMINTLKSTKKELSENVMIVDLVRNDLSRLAERGSVKVDELFGIYSFPNLHQMISTVSCNLEMKYRQFSSGFTAAIESCFPMGSMTGAPKVKAMELIDKYERSRRGLFSGTVGYLTPSGDFDLNVVIRSILFNKKRKYVSVMAGSAITAGSDPVSEYEECMLKAEPMLKALNC